MDEDNQIDFDTILEVCNPNDTHSFLMGFLEACNLFGNWKDGEQKLGSGTWSVKKVRKDIERFKREQV